MTAYKQLMEAAEKLRKLRNERLYAARRISLIEDNLNDLHTADEIFFNQIVIDDEEIDDIEESLLPLATKTETEEYNDSIKRKVLKRLRNILMQGERVYDCIEAVADGYGSVAESSANRWNGSEHLKITRKKAKELFVDEPKKIVENTFNCRLEYVKDHEKFDPDKMAESEVVGYMEVDNVKDIKDPQKDVGTFVYSCQKPAIIDNKKNKVMTKAVVETYIVKLSERLSKFEFVK